MKVRDTSQGRMYAISSEIGCRAINRSMLIDIPAGGQSVILALDKKIIIDGDNDAKFVEVRWGTNTAVGSSPVPAWLSDVLAGLISIVGEDNFDINYVPADENTESKLYLQFPLEVTAEQIKEVRSLLGRVLPEDLVLEMEWENGLPVMDDYMPLEYVDIVKVVTHDSVIRTNALDVELDARFVWNGYETANPTLLASTSHDSSYGSRRLNYYTSSYDTKGLYMVNDSGNRDYFPTSPWSEPTNKVISNYGKKIPAYTTRKQVHIHDCGYDMGGQFYQFEPSAIVNNVNWGKMCFGSVPTASKGNHWRIWRCTVHQNGEVTADLVPCTRVTDGTPGLWCNVYKKFYDQSPAATADLDWDTDVYNGVYYLTKEEIAALGISETEPPVEETLIEEIENA